MKKLSILVAALTLVLATGCGKTTKLTCTNTQTFSSAELKTETVISFKGEYAQKTKTTMTASFTSKEAAEAFANKYKETAGYKVKVNGEKVELVNEEKVSKDSQKKEDNKKAKVKEYLEGKGFSCK